MEESSAVLINQQEQQPAVLPFLKNLAGWATFKAIIDIIYGALCCLGIITAAFGVPRIISGVKLLNATDYLKKNMYSNDQENITAALYYFNQYFKFSGASIIVQIAMAIVLLILYIVLIVYIMSNITNFMQRIPGGMYF